MNRRDFVKISSAAGVGVLLSRVASFAAGVQGSLNNPDEVMLLLDKDWLKLKASNATNYSYEDVQVSLQRHAGELGVYLSSPSKPVKGIRFVWNHKVAAGTKALGDHWERTYGDVNWHSPVQNKKEPWYVILHDAHATACFGVKTGCNSFCWWNVGPQKLELTMDTHSAGVGVQLGQRKLHVADIITTKNNAAETPLQTAGRFCALMCEKPRLPKKPVYGINDWYYAYGNNSPKLILQQTKLMSELVTDANNKPFSVIDAGWAAYSPLLPDECCWQDDFSRPNEKFKDMAVLADQLKGLGMRPGLWTRPLCGKHDDPKNLLLPAIPGRNNPKNPVLDPTITENLERIKHNISTYNKWGYEMVKHDFSTYDITGRWGFEMTDLITSEGWQFNDSSRTTAEVIKNMYQSIRDAAGDMYLIGCNTVSHLSAGLFELNRIGDDTSGKEWDRTRKMGVNTLAFRMPQHKTFYAADGDCVGLTNQVPWEKNKQWMQLLAGSSAPLFISAQPDALGEPQRAFIKKCFAQAAKELPKGEPLDWMTNQLPKKWKLDHQVINFDWS